MIDRVSDANGRLGPVGDAEAMAGNILAIWNADRATMSAEARAQALQFSWARSMEVLFGEVYPAAFARRAGRVAPAMAPAAGSLVSAR